MFDYSSIALSLSVVARDNAIEALFLLTETLRSGSQKDIEAAEALYHEAVGFAKAAEAAWEATLPESIRNIDPYA